MSCSKLCTFRVSTSVSFAILALTSVLCAQGPLPEAPNAAPEAVVPVTFTQSRVETSHKFLDRQNQLLFVAAAASNAADFAVTRMNLQSGGRELNPVVRVFGRSSAGLAVNFAGETAGVISVCYFLHKTGHHRLERAVSMMNIASSAGAVSYGLMHR